MEVLAETCSRKRVKQVSDSHRKPSRRETMKKYSKLSHRTYIAKLVARLDGNKTKTKITEAAKDVSEDVLLMISDKLSKRAGELARLTGRCTVSAEDYQYAARIELPEYADFAIKRYNNLMSKLEDEEKKK